MKTQAVVLDAPGELGLKAVELAEATPADVVVDVEWSGISTGTERLLYSGRMPAFPGMGYPLVPGYEAVGRVASVGPDADIAVGTRVFVPGSRGFEGVRGLFGGAASRLLVDPSRIVKVSENGGSSAALLALVATAWHVLESGPAPELVVGHGVLGRLIARLALLRGEAAPVVWEREPRRRSGADGYSVIDPAEDTRRDYACICDVSGAVDVLDTLVGHLAPRGEVVLAGFYSDRVSFAFPPAFMRETRLRVSAEWTPPDLKAVAELEREGQLALDTLVTHHAEAGDAPAAYRTAFEDADCLKMILDWRGVQ